MVNEGILFNMAQALRVKKGETRTDGGVTSPTHMAAGRIHDVLGNAIAQNVVRFVYASTVHGRMRGPSISFEYRHGGTCMSDIVCVYICDLSDCVRS